ncbi:hypothetical protein ACFOEM_05530 [Paenalcaligenes hominis]
MSSPKDMGIDRYGQASVLLTKSLLFDYQQIPRPVLYLRAH